MRKLAIPDDLVGVRWFCTRFGRYAHLEGRRRVGATGREAAHSLCGRFLSDEVDSPIDGFRDAPRYVWKPCSTCLRMNRAALQHGDDAEIERRNSTDNGTEVTHGQEVRDV